MTEDIFSNIKNNLATIRKQIHECELRYQRTPNSVTLLAVSKTQAIEKIVAAFEAGQVAFGENYLQEALPKITALSDKKIEWHFIGPIQTNKTKKIAESFAWVQTVSDGNIAKRLNNQRPDHLSPLNICIQVNISGESTKHGVAPDAIFDLANCCREQNRLVLRGLMTIPAPKQSIADQRIDYHKLAAIYQGLNAQGFKLDTLSMGMSDDMEAAIAESSTMVRIGTAIFGRRA